jgi:hypothetical protein
MTLEDSDTYQLILERGIAKGHQGMVLRLGAKRFGVAPSAVEAAVRGVTDRDRLERMADRIFDATGWDDLLTTM